MWKETVKKQVKHIVSQITLSAREEEVKQSKGYRDAEWSGRLQF